MALITMSEWIDRFGTDDDPLTPRNLFRPGGTRPQPAERRPAPWRSGAKGASRAAVPKAAWPRAWQHFAIPRLTLRRT